MEEEAEGFALVVGKFDGVEWWWCGVCSKVGGENEGEEFFGVGRGVEQRVDEGGEELGGDVVVMRC